MDGGVFHPAVSFAARPAHSRHSLAFDLGAAYASAADDSVDAMVLFNRF
jgi:hypothetical protein